VVALTLVTDYRIDELVCGSFFILSIIFFPVLFYFFAKGWLRKRQEIFEEKYQRALRKATKDSKKEG
jgi:hypothetical protein